MADLNDIFPEEEGKLSDEELLRYLDAKASEQEMHEVEKKMTDSFAMDAVEGLQEFENKEKLNDYVKQLNKNLHQQLAAKKQRKEKRKIKELPMLFVVAIIILLLCVLGYVVIHLYQRQQQKVLDGKQQSSMIRNVQNTI